jgi:hypothetical protein
LYITEELSRRRFKRILKLIAKLNMKMCHLEGSPDHKIILDVINISKLRSQVFENITE